MDIIYSHGSCPDGFVAALIAKRRYPEAEVIFLDHGADHTENLKKAEKRDVLMLDFSLRTREENDALAASTRSFQIYDHHRTAEAVLKDAPYAIFDMKRSGAGLAWDYLFGKDSDNGFNGPRLHDTHRPPDRPWIVSYTEDRDLWNWKLPWSKEVCAFLGTLPFEFEAWESLYDMEAKDAAYKGEGALAHINHYVREAVKQAKVSVVPSHPNFPVQDWGRSIAVLNVPYLNCSEVGNELANIYDISLTWFERGDGIIQFSLRSAGDYDISAFAKAFGGGGHRNAAGFQMEYNRARLLIDVILGRSSHAYEPGKCTR